MTSTKTSSHIVQQKYIRILLIINTVLLVIIGTRIPTQTTIQQAIQETEIQKLGGKQNYELAQEIYQSDKYKKEQRFIREQNHKTYIDSTEEAQSSSAAE